MAGKKQIVGEVVGKATARFQPVGPRKLRYVADIIRGKTVGEAQTLLGLLHRPSAVPIIKGLLTSAVANSGRGDSDELIVARVWINGGPTIKRWLPRAFGRASRIRKRSSHATIELTAPLGSEEV
ncbi:50S ribosomal protein L22 [Candidatus Sumerlaeota bacterium]|nr:50S ribosomal protein L22 [Candidatus Sumerlaeota bacterium]